MTPVAQLHVRPPAKGPDRLHGWKEIAVYLGRGVRTVQRWERELDLPVYRLVTKGSEVVYARRSDLDAWMNSTERLRAGAKADPPVPLLRRAATRLDLGWAAITIAVSVVVLMGYANRREQPTWPFAAPPMSLSQPVSWRFDHQRLQVFDAQGNPVWEHAFEFPVDEGVYRTGFLADGQSPAAVIDDVNADGKAEVMMVPWAAEPGNRRFHCFGADGTLLFSAPSIDAASGRLASRLQEFSAGRFIVTGGASGEKSIWLTVPHDYKPETIVQRLDGSGHVKAEYLSQGFVTLLKSLTVNGRHVLMIGGSNSELQTATLALVDYADAAGHDPVPDDGQVAPCEGCSTAHPIAFLAFPRLDVATAVSRPPLVNMVQVRGDGGIDVSVLQARIGIASDRPFTHAAVVYSFSSDLRLQSAMATEGYRLAHSELQLAGRVSHAYGEEDRRAFFPLRAWNGRQLATLPAGARVPFDR